MLRMAGVTAILGNEIFQNQKIGFQPRQNRIQFLYKNGIDFMTQHFLNLPYMIPAFTFLNRVFIIVSTVVVCSLCGLLADDSVDIKNASRGAEQFINDYLSTPHGSYKAVIALF